MNEIYRRLLLLWKKQGKNEILNIFVDTTNILIHRIGRVNTEISNVKIKCNEKLKQSKLKLRLSICGKFIMLLMRFALLFTSYHLFRDQIRTSKWKTRFSRLFFEYSAIIFPNNVINTPMMIRVFTDHDEKLLNRINWSIMLLEIIISKIISSLIVDSVG